ncbi:DUF4917 family protein [Isosphaeraceae bacterium EP7]
MAVIVDDSLENYADVLDRFKDKRPALLLGNGASRAVWDDFKYPSLFDKACDANRPFCLSEDDIDVFRELDDTHNFELVLSSLMTSKRINEIFRMPTVEITNSYYNIRQALFSAVGEIHVPYALIKPKTKRAIKAELSNYRTIFTTNYDLLAYWSYMEESSPFKDFFWGDDNIFDPGNTSLWDDKTTILYLHGALHLYKEKGGHTRKHVTEEDGDSLLELIRKSDQIPLFVSEGHWKDKRAAILANDYLAFAYRTFSQNRINLVVFGQALNQEFDKHIVDSIHKMRGWNNLASAAFEIAISIFPEDSYDVIEIKRRLLKAFPNKTLYFYDSRTHPLGNSALRVGRS